MSIPRYGVIKGTVEQAKEPPGRHPHYHLLLKAAGESYDAAVNVESDDGSEVLYHVRYGDGFVPPNAQQLQALSQGAADLEGNDGIALDFVRTQGLVSRDEMTLLPISETKPTALHNQISDIIGKAIQANATVYVFGQLFNDGSGTNEYWDFSPDRGIHDIHMNQGNAAGSFGQDNGTFQDGAVLIDFGDGTWGGIFIAFQSQSWNTDDNGNPVDSQS